MAGQQNARKSATGCVVALFAPIAFGAALWAAWLICKAILSAIGSGATSAVRDLPVIPPGSHDSLGFAYAVYGVALGLVAPIAWDTFRERANPAVIGAIFLALGVVPAVLLNKHVTASYTPIITNANPFPFTEYAACGSLWTPEQSLAPWSCTAQLDNLFQWIATIAIGAVIVPLAYVGWVKRKGKATPDKTEPPS